MSRSSGNIVARGAGVAILIGAIGAFGTALVHALALIALAVLGLEGPFRDGSGQAFMWVASAAVTGGLITLVLRRRRRLDREERRIARSLRASILRVHREAYDHRDHGRPVLGAPLHLRPLRSPPGPAPAPGTTHLVVATAPVRLRTDVFAGDGGSAIALGPAAAEMGPLLGVVPASMADLVVALLSSALDAPIPDRDRDRAWRIGAAAIPWTATWPDEGAGTP